MHFNVFHELQEVSVGINVEVFCKYYLDIKFKFDLIYLQKWNLFFSICASKSTSNVIKFDAAVSEIKCAAVQ